MRKQASVLVCVALGAVGCTPAQFGKADLGDGGRQDGTAADVTPPHTCPPETPSQSKGMAESCSCDRECRTGFCADGVCCTTACGQTCMACNLPSSLGTCAMVPAGVTPNDPLVCAATTPATCGQDGTCDGKGACSLFAQGTHCKTGTCAADSVTGILTCDGKGNCSDAQPISQPCPPYTCDPTTHRCASSCTTDAQCSAGHQCVAGRCGKSPNGADCTTGDGCASGFCVDGVCCNVACAGSCVSCSQTGKAGICQPLPAGVKDSACIASNPTTCGRSGVCDGFGSCALYPENAVCGPSSCAGLSESTPRTCDGHGTCRESGLVDCSPFLCTNAACTQTCTTDTDCADGHQCVLKTVNGVTAGTCGLMAIGQPCVDPSRCQSGQCVDGVCCESSCTGACRLCNLPGSPGRCLNAAIGAADPRNTCKDLSAAACSTNGLCDGNGACQNYPVDSPCGKESCASGVYAPSPTCNASSQCVASRSRACSPFLCNGSTCYDICASDAQCVAGNYCANASCGLKPNGANCSVGTECQSSFCAQGVCCENACSSACMACNLPATPGICAAVADNAPDPQGLCAATQSTTCGTTGTCLHGACALYPQQTNCKAAVCATTSTATPASTCDGAGNCVPPSDKPCDPFTCSSGACKNSCTPATQAQDCSGVNICADNTCGLRANGAACTAANQCQSGFCTEGLCCNTACADATSGGLCKTCKGTKTAPAGTCSNVDSAGSDPKSRCANAKSDPTKGDCSNAGSCDGNGACQPWPSSTGCRQQSCTGSSLTAAATCDGKGACPTADSSSCGSYVCSSTSPTCLNTCNGNDDCSGTVVCNTVTHKCGDKSAKGDPCSLTTDCDTGLTCVDGRCCGSISCAECNSCNVAGSLGTCHAVADGTTDGACTATGSACFSGSCKKIGGQSCTTGTECASTYCVDNVCCGSSACDDCSSCNLTGSLGTCHAVADGTTDGACTTAGSACFGGICKSINGQACSPPGNCGSGYCVDGYCCDSACGATCWSCNVAGKVGTCSKVPANVADGTCPGTCTGAVASGLCDGSGTCITAGTNCASTGHICNSGLCTTSCAVDSDCATGYYCSGTSCVALKGNGATCLHPSECSSGVCISNGTSNICCHTSCTEATCGNTAMCAVGGGSCQTHAGQTCGTATCSGDGTSVIASACDGLGGCQAKTPAPCGTGQYCLNGACTGTKSDGASCTLPSECSSGVCISNGTSNICCHTSCTEATCGNTATCAVGGGSCQTHAGQTCGTATCSGDGTSVITLACDGLGGCQAKTPVPCDTGQYCSGGACLSTNPNGTTCGVSVECQSGNCVKGTCCISPNCDPGYLCLRGACVVSGGCTPSDNTGCDTGAGYTCDSGGVCQPPH